MNAKVIATTTAVSIVLLFASARAEITKTNGPVKIIEAPADIKTGRLEHDSEVRVFAEKTDFELPQPIKLDISKPGTSPKLIPRFGRKGKPKRSTVDPNLSPRTWQTGKRINCYYVHFDTVGKNKKTVNGSITFGERVLGLIIESDGLVATNGVLGVPGTQYPDGAAQDIELTRHSELTLSEGRRTVSFKLEVSTAADNFRVITDASEVKKVNQRNKEEDAPGPDDEESSPQRPGKPDTPQADILPAPSHWSGLRTLGNRGKQFNCQIKVERNGNLYTIVYCEHHCSMKIAMQFKLQGRSMVLQGWKNLSIADYTIHNLRARGSTDGHGMQIGYDWVQSGRGYQNAFVEGSIDVTRDR